MSKRITIERKAMLTASFAIIATLSFNPAVAESAEAQYTMSVIRDAEAGALVRAGEYESAAAQIEKRRVTSDRFARLTNLCVAYTKLGRIDEASENCNAAVEYIKGPGQRGYALSSPLYVKKTYTRDLAIALSNRAVLRAAVGELGAARQDLADARELPVELESVQTNIARLENDSRYEAAVR